MEKIAYFDCFSGASGDMILGALLDAGLDLDELRQALRGLGIEGEFRLGAKSVQRGALRATLADVEITPEEHQPDNEQTHPEHHHADDGDTHHAHLHSDEDHAHHNHPSRHEHAAGKHRHLPDIVALIEASKLSAPVRRKSLGIFQRLAEAEGSVHGIPPEQVHFHEVGAVDAIVDTVGAVWGLERMGVTQVFASPLPLGGGEIDSSHGTLPLPAPATLALLAAAGAPTRPWQTDKELVTPTGAAILTSLAVFKRPAMRLDRIGIGAGQRNLPWPNVLRLWLGTPLEEELSPRTSLTVLETNLDNMNPELIGHVMTRLFEAGALDVYLTPLHMKKNRPGTMLSVIARPEDEAAMAHLVLRETSTLGIRVHHCQRYEVARDLRLVDTPYGPVQVKLKWLDGRVASVSAEYEACRRAAEEHNVPLVEVYRVTEQAAANLLGSQGTPRGEKSGHA